MSTQALSSVSDNSHAKEVVRSAREQLGELLRQKAEFMKRIGTIKQTLAGLAKSHNTTAAREVIDGGDDRE